MKKSQWVVVGLMAVSLLAGLVGFTYFLFGTSDDEPSSLAEIQPAAVIEEVTFDDETEEEEMYEIVHYEPIVRSSSGEEFPHAVSSVDINGEFSFPYSQGMLELVTVSPSEGTMSYEMLGQTMETRGELRNSPTVTLEVAEAQGGGVKEVQANTVFVIEEQFMQPADWKQIYFYYDNNHVIKVATPAIDGSGLWLEWEVGEAAE